MIKFWTKNINLPNVDYLYKLLYLININNRYIKIQMSKEVCFYLTFSQYKTLIQFALFSNSP